MLLLLVDEIPFVRPSGAIAYVFLGFCNSFSVFYDILRLYYRKRNRRIGNGIKKHKNLLKTKTSDDTMKQNKIFRKHI